MSRYVVSIDERGRILIPAEVRRELGIGKGSQLILRVVGEGRVELVPLDRELSEVARLFEEKLKGWREEDHEAAKLLSKVVSNSGSS